MPGSPWPAWLLTSQQLAVYTLDVSKHRPSKATRPKNVRRNSSAATGKMQLWRRRVFHNSYTRKGRRMAVRGWSIKLQHHGRRHTFRLVAQTRATAAVEARAVHQALLSKGWDADHQQYAGPGRLTLASTDVRYWKNRLLLRPCAVPGAAGKVYSARIEHAGIGYYFPLGVAVADAAAAKALEIYRQVLGQGWQVVREKYPHEVTIAFHWSYNPLLWTYVTLQTVAGGDAQALAQAPADKSSNRILLAETNAALRGALALCINQNERCRCILRGEADVKNTVTREKDAALCLINSNLAEGMSVPAQLRRLPSGVPAVTYSVYSDSDQVFVSTPGGASGYGLRRLPPNLVLEPVLGVLGNRAVSLRALQNRIHSYFQEVFRSPSPLTPHSTALAQLTQRERDVLNLLSRACGDKEIAYTLGISIWTAREHVKRVFEKLNVHTRTEAALAYLLK